MLKTKIYAVLFGSQGCGKGTQGRLLADRFDLPLIGSGNMFRSEIAEKTQLGKLVKTYVDKGLLAPDEMVNAVVAHHLQRVGVARGFILDGYPRNVDQAMHLDRIIKINLAVYIRISDATAVRRLVGRRQCVRCGALYHVTDVPPTKPDICTVCGGKLKPRSDDTESAIRKRLASFHFMTEPLAAYYRQRGVLLVVNGEQAIPYVFEDLIKKMSKLGFS